MRWMNVLVLAAAIVAGTCGCQDSATTEPIAVPVAKKADDVAPDPMPIARTESGTRLKLAALPALTNIVFISRPQITSGEVGKVGKAIKDALHTFRTVVLVQAEPDPEHPGRFRRGPFSIGIGFPEKEDEIIVVTKATADKHGISLGFFESKVLAEREKELNTVLSPGNTPTMAMFDFTAVQLRDDKRSPVTLRYAAMIDPADGQMDVVYSPLEPTPDGYRFIGDSATQLPRNHTMDWEMHVDGGKVSFGAPKADAFAVTKLPQGTTIAATDELKHAVTARSFTAESAARLERLLRERLNRR